MADVITRFRLETTQYDSKLRDAAKGIREFTNQVQLGGKNFTDFSQKAVESARALGTVASGAMNTKEKVRDLVGAYNEAARAYNSLNQTQQQTDFGKSLAASLETLKGRITEAKQELYGMNEAVEEAGKKSGSLFGEGGLTGMIQVFGGNLLAEGVSKLTSEITDSVQESIELARQGEGIRMAFERLNQPGLLDNLKEATHGTVSEIELMKQAIKFENFKLPLEDLGTYLAFAQQRASDTGDSIDNMVNSIVTGLGRQSVQILDNLGISATEIRNRMKEGGDMTKVVADIIREEMDKAGGYVETAATRAARATADTKNKMEKLGRSAMPVAEEFTTAWNEIRNGAMTLVLPVLKALADSISNIREILSGEWSFDAKISKMPDIGSNIDDNGNFIRKPSNGNWAGFNAQTGQYNDAVTAIQDIVVTGHAPAKRKGSSGGRSGRVSSVNLPSIDDFNKQLGKSMIDTDALKADDLPSDAWNTMREAIAGCKEEMADYSAETANWTKNFDPYRENMEKMTKAAKQQQMAFNMGAEAASNLGAAFASMEDPAAKASGVVLSAIANIVLGFAQASVQAAAMGPYGWVAFLAAGAAALATTISAVHSLTGFSEGGVVQGNSYSGDQIPAMLNAGETVLTAAQTNNLASSLQGGAFGDINLSGVIKGENIFVAADRYAQRSGKGEILTFK